MGGRLHIHWASATRIGLLGLLVTTACAGLVNAVLRPSEPPPLPADVGLRSLISPSDAVPGSEGEPSVGPRRSAPADRSDRGVEDPKPSSGDRSRRPPTRTEHEYAASRAQPGEVAAETVSATAPAPPPASVRPTTPAPPNQPSASPDEFAFER